MSRNSLIAVAAAIAAAIIAIVIGDRGWNAAEYQPNILDAAGRVATTLFVVALFLERAMAVVNDLLFGAQTVDLTNKVRLATMSGAPTVAQAQWELDALEDDKRRIRLAGSFLFAVLVAAAGARTLGGLVIGTSPPLTGPQLQLFRTMDILLTAALLAGGSNGIAAIIDLLRKRVETARARLTNELAQAQLGGAPGALLSRYERAGFTALPFLRGKSAGAVPALPQPGDGADDDLAFLEWTAADERAAASLSVATTSRPPRVAASLDKLKSQLNASFPNRSRDSDGDIGDERHCPGGGGGSSDHCANIPDGDKWVVTAFDATHDPANRCDMNAVTDAVVASRDPRIKYIIWNRRICASYPVGNHPAWAWRPYGGENPHVTHAHFSVRPEKEHYDDVAAWSIA